MNKLIKQANEAVEQHIHKNKKKLKDIKPITFLFRNTELVYRDTYWVTLIGLPFISLIGQGVLLERALKDLLLVNGLPIKQVEGMDYGNALIASKSFLTKKEFNSFLNFKDPLRNVQVHQNILKKVKTEEVSTIDFNDILDGGNKIILSQRSYGDIINVMDCKNDLIIKMDMDYKKIELDYKSYINSFMEINKLLDGLSKRILKKAPSNLIKFKLFKEDKL